MTATTIDTNPRIPPSVAGPKPMKSAMLAALGTHRVPKTWLDTSQHAEHRESPPPTVWNTRQLVVTGVTPSYALMTALHQPNDYTNEELRVLMTEAQPSSTRELRTAIQQATGRPLPQDADQWLPKLTPGTRRARSSNAATAQKHMEMEQSADMTPLKRLSMDIISGLSDAAVLRTMMRGIPRTMMHMTAAERKRVMDLEPKLTGTKWDPFFGSIVEHLAWVHREKSPAWVERRERFAEPPLNYAGTLHADGLCSAPAAFIRHGTLTGPQDLDSRGGERVDWTGRQH